MNTTNLPHGRARGHKSRRVDHPVRPRRARCVRVAPTIAAMLGIGLATPGMARAQTGPEPGPTDAETSASLDAAAVPERGDAPPQVAPPSSSLESSGPGSVLTIARCPYAAPAIPAQTDAALDATLLVESSAGVGSAVLVSPDGFALTAAHVVVDDTSVSVLDHAGNEHPAEVVRVDVDQDAALLKVDWTGPAPCLTPAAGDVQLGSDVFILGSPAGQELSFSVSKGAVSGYRSFEGTRWVQLDAAINPGNSGGPAVSSEGTIVGLASWKVSHVSVEGLAFAVPIEAALAALDLELGAASDPQWRSMRRGVGSPDAFEASPQPAAASGAPPSRRRLFARPPRPKRERKPPKHHFDGKRLIPAGAVLVGIGTLGVAATAIAHAAVDETTLAGWHTMQAANAASWGVGGVGAGVLVTGLVFHRQHKRAQTAMHVVPIAGGAALRGRF